MDLRPIRSEADYKKALAQIETLLDAEIGSPEGDALDVLTTLVSAYEQKHFAIDTPDPIEYLKNIMAFRGAGQNDLAKLLNSRPRASEILSKRRPLTLDQIRKIATQWRVPADPLIREYELTG